jgi:malic enzyme
MSGLGAAAILVVELNRAPEPDLAGDRSAFHARRSTNVCPAIAEAVAVQAVVDGVAQQRPEDERREAVQAQRWWPTREVWRDL